MHRELTGDWTFSDEMAAAGLEVAHAHYRTALAVGGVKRSKLPKPLHIPRPTPWVPSSNRDEVTRPPRQPQRRKATTVAEVAAVLAAGFGPAKRR